MGDWIGGVILSILGCYVLMNLILVLRLMRYWESTEGRHLRWKDVMHILLGDYDHG